jgi:hypothetical protein
MDSEKSEIIRASNLTCKELVRGEERVRGLLEGLNWAESVKKDRECSEGKLARDRGRRNRDCDEILAEKGLKENVLFEKKRKLEHIKLDIELKCGK